MEAKKWYMSKTVWFNIMTFLGGLGLLVADFLGAGEFSPQAFVMLGVAVINAGLRIWFTEMPIE